MWLFPHFRLYIFESCGPFLTGDFFLQHLNLLSAACCVQSGVPCVHRILYTQQTTPSSVCIVHTALLVISLYLPDSQRFLHTFSLDLRPFRPFYHHQTFYCLILKQLQRIFCTGSFLLLTF